MLNRRLIIEEMLRRIRSIEGEFSPTSVLLDPVIPHTSYPAISLFEDVDERITKGAEQTRDISITKNPLRDFRIITEIWLEDVSPGEENKKIIEFYETIRKAIIGLDGNLARQGNCAYCYDIATSKVIRPEWNHAVVGIATEWVARYVDIYD